MTAEERKLTSDYIISLFEGIRDCSDEEWLHNKGIMKNLIEAYATQKTQSLYTKEQVEGFIDEALRLERKEIKFHSDKYESYHEQILRNNQPTHP